MTDKELVQKVAMKLAPDFSAYPIMGDRYGVKSGPMNWGELFREIGMGAISFSDEIRDQFKAVFADELRESPKEIPPVDRSKRCTTDGKPPIDPSLPGAPGPIGANGQHSQYWVLCEEERNKGWVRPYRDAYRHDKCGAVTTMGRALSETYARDPSYYGSTFCCTCGAHFPVAEFTWTKDGERVGS